MATGAARVLRGLDLFCGLGGWSDGLALEGFDVTGVEIEPKIAALYKHKVIVADVCELNPKDFKGYDLIVGSPPCRDFSIFAARFGKTWKKNPPNPEQGLILINAFLNFVKIAQPTYWLMENNPRLEKWIKIKPRQVSCLGNPAKQQMRRAFWDNYPAFFTPADMTKQVMRFRPEVGRKAIDGKLGAWERARIPLPVARALGAVVRGALEEER